MSRKMRIEKLSKPPVTVRRPGLSLYADNHEGTLEKGMKSAVGELGVEQGPKEGNRSVVRSSVGEV